MSGSEDMNKDTIFAIGMGMFLGAFVIGLLAVLTTNLVILLVAIGTLVVGTLFLLLGLPKMSYPPPQKKEQ